jgi:UrcA family protein
MGSIKKLSCAFWLLLTLAGLAPGLAVADRAAAPAATPAPQPSLKRSPQGSGDTRSIRIAYHDLDLATPEGIAVLYLRIQRAADELCGAERTPTGTRLLPPRTDACVRDTVAATVKQIGVPGLAALDVQQQVLREAASETPLQCERPPRARIII